MNLFRVKDGKYTNQKFNGSTLLVRALVLVCFAIAPMAKAVIPAPDGGYPGQNTAEGQSAFLHLAGGTYNTALGWASLGFNVTGNFNTGVGAATLLNTTASENTATGAGALLSNSTGTQNTANGAFALLNNTTGNNNTSIGDRALFSNTIGGANTANGVRALFGNTQGVGNTATGFEALVSNTIGSTNTANGFFALASNTADENTATGAFALLNNTTGDGNTATGFQALDSNTGGINNTAVGNGALRMNQIGSANTAVGLAALGVATGDHNIALGDAAGDGLLSGSFNIYIGNFGFESQSNSIHLGDPASHFYTFIAGIYGASTTGGIPVYIDAAHRLGTTTSSKRFKQDIKPMDKASEALLALQPVVFRYKKDIDPAGTRQLGLVAEDVEKVNPDLVVRDKEGKPYSVRYDQVNAMLLNEFLKEHRKVEEQGATIAQLRQDFQSRLSAQEKQIESLTAGLQKVTAQLETSKPAPHVVNNP